MVRYRVTALDLPGRPVVELEHARTWQAADEVVHSRSLATVDTARTELVADPDADDVRRREEQADRDLSTGGAELAAAALRAGLADEVGLVIHPVVVGGGTRALPLDVRLDLALLEERRLSAGAVHLRHRVR
ncbi:dihydrofolate reductase family protein [Streptomyces sp. NP160]|uniref:dihydrofolate reductase family protein n=1 Tax=Streptomyces sp. NP160 TaxID=2586637 RepID=UPI0015D647F8|nr:dihydrofolate reductase family protein [Streptomyces sp. NP160]